VATTPVDFTAPSFPSLPGPPPARPAGAAKAPEAASARAAAETRQAHLARIFARHAFEKREAPAPEAKLPAPRRTRGVHLDILA